MLWTFPAHFSLHQGLDFIQRFTVTEDAHNSEANIKANSDVLLCFKSFSWLRLEIQEQMLA